MSEVSDSASIVDWFVYSCSSYGTQQYQNRVLYEFHAFSMVVIISLAMLIFSSQSLKKIYLPLYRVVNAALFMQLLSDVVYFAFVPYPSTQGNCSEMILNRFCIILIMFGEMHQLYFIANVLGCTKLTAEFCGVTLTFPTSLESILRITSVLAAISILASLYVKKMFMMAHDVWALFIIAAQLLILVNARKSQDRWDDHQALVNSKDEGVRIFEIITWLQLLPLCVSLLDRILEFDGIFILVPLDGVMMILEFLSIYLFYIKVLVLREKASTVRILVEDV